MIYVNILTISSAQNDGMCHGPTWSIGRPVFNKKDCIMFPEFRDAISRLKVEDAHFARLFAQHNALDQDIKNREAGIVPSSHAVIETLKKEKLQLKDQLYAILRRAQES